MESATRGKAEGGQWGVVWSEGRAEVVGADQWDLEIAQCVGLAHCTERVALEQRWFGDDGC